MEKIFLISTTKKIKVFYEVLATSKAEAIQHVKANPDKYVSKIEVIWDKGQHKAEVIK
jgi:hypothetical protein